MAAAPAVQVTSSAPSNIACIKYWGKRDVRANTPINSSVSVTMNQDDLRATTTVTLGAAGAARDRLFLNGAEEDLTHNKRVAAVLRELRARAPERLRALPATVVSRNNFPTAAGLASSAAGYACLVHALSRALEVRAREDAPGELTAVARQGSGSACRSLYGGFVEWQMGARVDGSDSIAVQVADEAHWPALRLLIAVVSDKKKDTGSTDGMVRSVATSTLLRHRAQTVVPQRLEEIKRAFHARDFATFAQLTMQDSNQFHACCLDTFPPVFYLNDTSRRIIQLVHRLNEAAGRTVAGYTFDAGPNAVIFTLKEDAARVLALLLAYFPAAAPGAAAASAFESSAAFDALRERAGAPAVASELAALGLACPADEAEAGRGLVRHIYFTSVGDGPRALPAAERLAGDDGLPLEVAKRGDEGFDKGL
jgi:diphosphomevalonate decarboxylase